MEAFTQSFLSIGSVPSTQHAPHYPPVACLHPGKPCTSPTGWPQPQTVHGQSKEFQTAHTLRPSFLHPRQQMAINHHSVAQPAAVDHGHHICPYDLRLKDYASKGDLTRHIRTVHEMAAHFHYRIDMCPRSIPGNGFPRKDKLVDHLKSKKRGLSHEQAGYQATLHDLSGGFAVR